MMIESAAMITIALVFAGFGLGWIALFFLIVAILIALQAKYLQDVLNARRKPKPPAQPAPPAAPAKPEESSSYPQPDNTIGYHPGPQPFGGAGFQYYIDHPDA